MINVSIDVSTGRLLGVTEVRWVGASGTQAGELLFELKPVHIVVLLSINVLCSISIVV